MEHVRDNTEMVTYGDYYEMLVRQGLFQTVEEADAYFAAQEEAQPQAEAEAEVEI